MNIDPDDLLEAFGRHSPPLLLAALSKELKGRTEPMTGEEVGSAILHALCPDARKGDLGAKHIVGAEMFDAQGRVWLTPEQCFMAPPLSDWAPNTLGQAVFQIIEQGCTRVSSLGGSPTFDAVGLMFSGAVFTGQASMTFQTGAKVILYFGQPPMPGLFASQMFGLSGEGLLNVGRVIHDQISAKADLAEGLERIEHNFITATASARKPVIH